MIAGIVVVALLAALNVKGTQESSRLNLVLAIGDLATQILLVVIGIALVLDPSILVDNVHLGVAPTWGDAALGIAVGMIAYTGIETISNMAEEARDAERTVPRGTQLVVLAVLGLYVLLPVIALSAMPVTQNAAGDFSTELGTTFAGDPVLGIVENLGLGAGLTEVMRIYVGVLAAVILLIATNAALIGVSRLTFSMGHYRQLPERLRQVHPRFNTPYVAILAFSGVAALTMVPGQTDFLATMYSFGAMLSFTVAHISVLRLRQRFPDMKRGWKPAWNFRFRGVELPLTAVLGGLGTFSAWIVVMALNLRTLVVGAAWMLLGIAVYYFYRRHCELPLVQTVKVVTPEPLGVQEVEYQSVLVAFEERALLEGGGGDGRPAGGAAATRDPRAGDRQRAHQPAAGRAARGAGVRGAEQDRAGQADRRHEGDGQRAEGAPRPGGPGDRRGGSRDQGGRDRDAASLPKRDAAVREDASDRARRATLPRDRRRPAGGEASQPRRSRASGPHSSRGPLSRPGRA